MYEFNVLPVQFILIPIFGSPKIITVEDICIIRLISILLLKLLVQLDLLPLQFDFDSASPPEQAWRRKLNGHANILKEFSVTFVEAIKMVSDVFSTFVCGCAGYHVSSISSIMVLYFE